MKPVPSLLLLAYLLVPRASAEIFKCEAERGQDKYQNFPCAIDSIGSRATAPASQQAMPDARASAPVLAAMSDENSPQRGMTMEAVRGTWGAPKTTKIIAGMETWYYRGPGDTRHSVHFDRTGSVRFVSHPPPPPRPEDH